MAQTYPCIIADSRSIPLSRGILESARSEGVWHVRVLDGGIDRVQKHRIVQLIGTADELSGMVGRIIGSDGDAMLTVERVRTLGTDARQNLRIPVRFDSFVYPVSGAWKGRRPIVSQDLSCGGIAFFCSPPLEMGEIFEVVVPITAEPLILKAKICRRILTHPAAPLLSAGFVNMIHDEEVLMREAVFSQQIRNRDEG